MDILIGAIIGIACVVLYNNYFKKEHLKEEFRNISNEILAQQADSIAKKATDTVETTNKAIINPLETQLKEIKEYVEGVEKERKQDKGSMTTELENLSKVHKTLNESTIELNNSLSGNTTTGRWGNQKLRNIVEMAGMTQHVDFDMEVDTDAKDEEGIKRRVDGLIKLSDGGKIPIDAKTSLTAFLKIDSEQDQEEKQKLIKKHTTNVHNHIKELYKERKYHTLFKKSVPLTIMFVPHEPALNTAFNEKPDLFEEAINHKIVVASASSLYSLLKVIAEGWEQVTVDENQKKIVNLSEKLYNAAVSFTNKYYKLGQSINDTLKDYNDSVKTFDKTFKNSRLKLIKYGVDKSKVKQVKNDVEELLDENGEDSKVREPKEFREEDKE